MQEVLRLENISKSFGSVLAVDRLNLNLRANEFVTILGPSGCGKSTVLRIIGGFETPDVGRVIIGGGDATLTSPSRRKVNMVFQDYALFPHLSVERNIRFGLEVQGWPSGKIMSRVEELMGIVQLQALKDRMPHELSGGQRQRVALARALAPNPEILLLDEPMAALDAKLRRTMQIELRALQRKTQTTFILVTHDQDEALTMSDRVILMRDGRIQQAGSPGELYREPNSKFVADFIGEMNFLESNVTSVSESTIGIDWNGQTLGAKIHNSRAPIVLGQKVTLAVRPEDIIVSDDRPRDAENYLNAAVRDVIFRGSTTHYMLDVDGANIVSSRGQTSSRGSCWISWSADCTLVL